MLGARLYDGIIGQRIFRAATVNVAISQAVQRFIQRFDTRPAPVIYRGLNLEKYNNILPALPPSITSATDKIVIVTACRLYQWKGLQYAIQAIQELPPATQSNIIYAIAGSGEDARQLSRQAKPPVVLLGALSHERCIGLLKWADIYLHPSLKGGGLSTSLLEAMYCECAAITTPHEGADEFIQDGVTGIMIPAAAPHAISRAIERLVAERHTRRTLGQAARQRVQGTISWDASWRAFERLIVSLT
jgi:glycosyltransferase involved in cell wall biosynthesis